MPVRIEREIDIVYDEATLNRTSDAMLVAGWSRAVCLTSTRPELHGGKQCFATVLVFERVVESKEATVGRNP